MAVMQIRRVGMLVLQGLVSMPMCVLAIDSRFVRMIVVCVIMLVRTLMLDGSMDMLVLVLLVSH